MEEAESGSGVSVKVTSSDFEYALMHLTPSNRRHVSQFDLVSLQKPQSLLYDAQNEELKRLLIQPNLKRNIAKDASGKVTWQVLEPLVIKILYDGASHPESFIWRFVCGIGDALDGFTVHPVDLMTLRDDSSGFENSLWRGLNDARVKGGAFCVLFKSFNALEREERAVFVKTVKRFTNSLMPGEPVILIFTSKNGKEGENQLNSVIKKFRISVPSEEQTRNYLQFVLRSVYRILSTETTTLTVSEEDFMREVKCPEGRSVLELEKFRIEIGDVIRKDPEAYFGREIFATTCDSEKVCADNCDDSHASRVDKDDSRVDNDDSRVDNDDNSVDNIGDSYAESDAPEEVLFK